MFSQLMKILPTYFPYQPDLAPIESPFPKLGSAPENEILNIWNKLLCPQCILGTVIGNTLVVSIGYPSHVLYLIPM